jgi:hypothetical protein
VHGDGLWCGADAAEPVELPHLGGGVPGCCCFAREADARWLEERIPWEVVTQ